MPTSATLTINGCFLLMLFGFSKSESNRHCLPTYEGGSLCFIQPDPPLALSWRSATDWCKSIGATLPIVNRSGHNSIYKNSLDYFGLQTEILWLGANSYYDPNHWLWTNGANFTGIIEERDSPGKTHAYVIRNGTALKFVAANPFDENYYICRASYIYSERKCASSQETFWINETCYRKYKYSWTPYSWYYIRSTCGQSNLPSYNDLKEFSRWLDNLGKFWIGLRCGWWIWHDMVSGRSSEVFENPMGGNLPSITYGQCLASNGTYYSSSNWINRNCSRDLQFVCQQHVNAAKDEPAIPIDESVIEFTSPAIGLDVGLGVGLGVLFLAVTICLVLLTVHARRRNGDGKHSLMGLRKQSENNPKTTSSNAYDNYTFNVASETLGRKEARNPYKPVNLKANEYVY